MFSVGKLKKILFLDLLKGRISSQIVPSTVSEKCTCNNITKRSCAICFQELPYSIYSWVFAQTLVVSKKCALAKVWAHADYKKLEGTLMLSRKIFENLHSIMAILVPLEQVLRQILFELVALNFEVFTKYRYDAIFSHVFDYCVPV